MQKAQQSNQIIVEDTLSHDAFPNADRAAETGSCPRIDKHTLILPQPQSLFWAQLASLFYLSVSLSGWLSTPPPPPLSPTPPVLFQTAALSRPYLCFRQLLCLLPLIFDFARYRISCRGACVASTPRLVGSDAKKKILNPCYRLDFKVSPASTSRPTYLLKSEICVCELLSSVIFLTQHKEKRPRPKCLRSVAFLSLDLKQDVSTLLPQKNKNALNLRQERSDVNVLSRAGCKGNIWWDHWCAEASDTWSETGPTLNDRSVFSCLQLVFCFMDYSDSRVTVLSVRLCRTDKTHRRDKESPH